MSGPEEIPLRVHKALSYLKLSVFGMSSFGIFKTFSLYERFPRDQMGSEEYKNSQRELRHHFIKCKLLVNTSNAYRSPQVNSKGGGRSLSLY